MVAQVDRRDPVADDERRDDDREGPARPPRVDQHQGGDPHVEAREGVAGHTGRVDDGAVGLGDQPASEVAGVECLSVWKRPTAGNTT